MDSRGDPPGPAANSEEADLLNGWKDIAAFIGKSERTAIRWEKELGLPVHRLRGQAADIVCAQRSEIEAWRRRREAASQVPAQTATADGSTAAITESPSPLPHRWRRSYVSLLAAAVILVLVGWQTAMRRAPVPPAPQSAAESIPARPHRWDVSADALSINDEQGQRLWEYAFGFQLSVADYTPPQNPGPHPPPRLVQIIDLEGDGTSEVLFVAHPLAEHTENSLYCFESNGRLRFKHTVTDIVRFGNDDYGPPFGVGHLLVTENIDRSRSIWIRASHRQEFATVIRKLDAHGRPLGEYWSNGHALALVDMTLAGRRVVLVGGTANDSKRASLAVLDYDRPTGRAPSLNAKYRCSSCPQIDPVAFLLFPETELAREIPSRAYVAEVVPQPGGGLRLTVLQTNVHVPGVPGLVPADVYYRLDDDLQVTQPEIGDSYARGHALLEGAGRLTHRFGARDVAELSPILRWDGQRFEPRPVLPDDRLPR